MSRSRFARFVPFAIALALSSAFVAPLSAQPYYHSPWILDGNLSSPYAGSTATIDVGIYFPMCGGPPTDLQFKVNGVNRTSYFGTPTFVFGEQYGWYPCYDGQIYNVRGTNVPLVPGQQNTLIATSGGFADTLVIDVLAGGAPPTVALVNHNRDNLDRSLCLTVAAGDGAEVQCGDLVAYHAMPVYKTMNVARSLTPIYNSATADPRPRVAALVTLPAGQQPQSVFAQLTVGGATRASATYASWAAGASRQLTLAFDASDLPTGLYPFNLLVRSTYSSEARETTVTDTMVVVNRESSEFGAGWYLTGVETLVLGQPGGSILWVGGDGSAKVYRSIGSGQWQAAAGTYRDSIVQVGSNYERRANHGVRVTFDGAGRHIQTRNRLGKVTTFGWVNGRLDNIVLPPLGSTYQLAYDGAGKLDRITDPAGRVLDATVTGGVLTQLVDPDLRSVSFGYDGEQRLRSRTNRKLAISNYYYDNNLRITKLEQPLSSQTDLATTTFTNWDELGLAVGVVGGTFTAVDPVSVRTLVNGPRTDAPDTTTFYLNRFGAPTKTVNALGHQTLVSRADSRWPALPTEVQAPNGFVKRATYDDRANMATQTAVNPFGNGQDATTQYHWNARWNLVDTITSPLNVVTTFGYDTANGNRLWQQIGPDAARRVTFRYSNSFGLLSSTVLPQTPSDSIEYDLRGNLASYRTPLGFKTTYVKDAIGRDTLVKTPLDSAATRFHRSRTAFDAAGRDSLAQVIGETLSGQPTQIVTITKSFDLEDNVLALTRVSSPDSASIGPITTQWRYDVLGRVVAEVAPDSGIDSTVYDPAGDAIRLVTRRGHIIQQDFDVLGRMTRRILPEHVYADTTYVGQNFSWRFPTYPTCQSTRLCVPADTSVFVYDAMDHILSATNRAAQVGRTYYTGGDLQTDTLRIRTIAELSAGGSFGSHQYVTRHGYDLEGRRSYLKLSSNLAAQFASGAVMDSIAYGYDPTLGWLNRVRDVIGNELTYAYDSSGRVTRVNYPQGHFKKFTYDYDSRVKTIRQDQTVTEGSGAYNEIALTYDAAQRLAYVRPFNDPYRSRSYEYTPLGAAMGELTNHGTWTSNDFSGIDPLANNFRGESTSGGYDVAMTYHDTYRSQRSTFQAGTGRRTAMTANDRSTATCQPSNYCVSSETGSLTTQAIRYDYAGAEVFSAVQRRDSSRAMWNNTPWGISYRSDQVKASYYAADSRLAVVDHRSSTTQYTTRWTSAYEEFRYDALGRRILHRTRDCTMVPDCQAQSARFVWDGDRILSEINFSESDPERDNGWTTSSDIGRVVYTHGAELDQPLTVTRIGYRNGPAGSMMTWDPFAVAVHWDHRGHGYDHRFYPNPGCKTGSNGGTYCIPNLHWVERDAYMHDISYPSSTPVYFNQDLGVFFGSLVIDQRDASGLLFRRNRYYDPATGRFTQEDPIGVAGGLNLYGFGGGDPVNFSDPFGLCVGVLTPFCPQILSALGALALGTAAWIATKAFTIARPGEVFSHASPNEEAVRPEETPPPQRTIDDPGSLTGATPDEVEAAIPAGWVKRPTREGEGTGTRWLNPERSGEAVRVMPGKTTDPNPVKQGPYVRVSKNGKVSDPIPLHGNPTLDKPK